VREANVIKLRKREDKNTKKNKNNSENKSYFVSKLLNGIANRQYPHCHLKEMII